MQEPSKDSFTCPAPHPVYAALRMLVQAHLRTLPRRKGERFLKELATVLSKEETVRMLLPARTASQHAAVAKSRDEAAAWLRQVLPELVRSLADK